MNTVGIFTTSADSPTINAVSEVLNERGYQPWIFYADRIASGQDYISLQIQQSGVLTVQHNEKTFNPVEVTSAWLRHPQLLRLVQEDRLARQSIVKEIQLLQESVWSLIPEQSWLNSPVKMQALKPKIAQLAIAASLGFDIPKTIVTNDWDTILNGIETDPLLIKMAHGELEEATGTRVLYASKLPRSSVDSLRAANPYPAIYQEYLRKKREWRVTVVGEDVFSASIYTNEASNDDWRKHQLTGGVEFRAETFSDTHIEQCIEFLRHFGVIYGAFDFVESPEGRITFLECNANGQYIWLEKQLGFPISERIAAELIRIYNTAR